MRRTAVALSLLSNLLVLAPALSSFAKPGTNSFATLLCDDDTLPAVEALANSLRISKHSEPFIVVVPASISAATLTRLKSLNNTQPFQAANLRYPFKSTTSRMNIQKPCRFLKLQLWGLTEWRKIVFLDADTIVRKNVAELFDAPGFSAVKDPVGMNYNTGVMVIEPSRYVYSLISKNYAHAGSYNIGDQGALNALVSFDAWTPLSMHYNTFHNAPAEAFAKAKIIHYSGDAKPWNFWRVKGKGRIPTRAFVEWCRMAEKMPSAACHMRGEIYEDDFEGSARHFYDDTVREHSMSVLLSTYDRKSWRDLAAWYARLDIVKEVYVVWQNAKKKHESAPHEKVKFIFPKDDSLNNRYLSSQLSSNCVYICDDDIYLPESSFRAAFEVWKQNSARLVGFYPRLWDPIPGTYTLDISKGYNIVLTKGMFAHRAILTAYNLFLPKRLASYVDRNLNCEDILFNMLAVGMTGLPPLAVMSNETIYDIGKDTGISGKKTSGHLNARDVCVQEFVKMGMSDPGLLSSGSILPMGRKNKVLERV